MVSPLSGADTALLGLLCEQPMHAWQIQKEVIERDMRFWTDLSQSTIYKQLHGLRRGGLVESRPEAVNGRLRKVYAITGAGRDALRAALRTRLSEPQHLKWQIDLGTYNIVELPHHERIECLETYRTRLGELIEGYRRLDEFMESSGCPLYHRAVARRPVYLLEAEIRWVNDFLEELRPGEAEKIPPSPSDMQ